MKKEPHFLDSVKWGVIPIVNYRGRLVERLSSGKYKIYNRKELTAEQVDEAIEEVENNLVKSINRTR